MAESLASHRRAARLAGVAAIGLVPAFASMLAPVAALAQEAAPGLAGTGTGTAAPGGGSPTGVLPLGLPPAAVILNSPIGGLPNTLGTGDVRHQLQAPTSTAPGAPAFSITPSIGVDELYNDNVFQSSSDRQGDFITAITPGIQVSGSTPRVTLNLQYAPSLVVYARNRSLDAIAQQGVASGTAELVPDTLFVTARALASVQPSGGGLGGLGSGAFGTTSPIGGVGVGTAPGVAALGKNNISQNIGFSVTPYVVHRFGDYGTGKAGVTLTDSTIIVGSQPNAIPGTVTVGTQRQQSAEATAQFQSGEALGRIHDFALVDATRSAGTGVLSGARDDTVTNWVGYALNRMVLPFVEFGAESIYYNTAPPLHINDGVWEVGVVLAPNADSQLSLGYGHHEGFNSADIRGYYQVTARTRLTATYSTALTTNVQQIESQLGLTSFDQFGNAVDAGTGAPLFLGNGLLSTQDALFRTRTLNLTGTTVLDRDTISVSVQHQNQTPVGNASGSTAGTAESGTTFSGSWTHAISDRLNLGTGVSYSLTNYQTATAVDEKFLGVTAGVSYQFTETISTVARYAFYDRVSQFAGRSFNENVILVGLTKKF